MYSYTKLPFVGNTLVCTLKLISLLISIIHDLYHL
nr:MAG TPA: protein of unknown function DUF1868 [Caudoviricetes sp.]